MIPAKSVPNERSLFSKAGEIPRSAVHLNLAKLTKQ